MVERVALTEEQIGSLPATDATDEASGQPARGADFKGESVGA